MQVEFATEGDLVMNTGGGAVVIVFWTAMHRARCIARARHAAGCLAALLALTLGACESPVADQPSVETQTPSLANDSVGERITALVNFDVSGARLSRFDVTGNALDAHGGEVRLFGDTYYLYGESYACGYEWKVGGSPFCGFRVYSSPDLVNWTDRGLMVEPTPYWQARCSGFTYGCYRPHVLHNPTTGKYVLWINSAEVSSSFHVLESDSPVGPFVDLDEPVVAANRGVPPGVNNGDHDLFQDGDGQAYITYTDWRAGGDIVIERLAPDYRSGTGEYVRLGLTAKESPSLFKRGLRYYITMSDPNCGYCTTGTSFVTATSPLGPWSKPKSLTTKSCGGQPGHVAELPGSDGESWYLYQSDLWNERAPNQATADLYWGALSFDEGGMPRNIDCGRVTRAPVLSRDPATLALPAPARARLVCDVGTRGAAGEVQRELRFTPAASARLSSVAFPTFHYGRPDARLVVELRVAGAGAPLKSVAIPNDLVSWSARRIAVPIDTDVVADTEYAIRIRADVTRGCYGLAYRDDLPRPAGAGVAYVSTNGGATWVRQEKRTLQMDLTLQ